MSAVARRLIVVSSLVAVLLAGSAPARSEHLVPYVASAQRCLPANLTCAYVQFELRYHFLLNVGIYTLRSFGFANVLLVPGSFEERISVTDPGGVLLYEDSDACAWGINGGGCAVQLDDRIFQVPESLGCTVPLTVDVSGTARAIDDPILRLIPVNARLTRTLRLCPDGTVLQL